MRGNICVCAWLAIASVGCSFVSLRPPPTAPGTAQRRKADCGGNVPTWLYPAADATWAIGGVVVATRDSAKLAGEDRPDGFGGTIHSDPDPDTQQLLKVERALAYASLVGAGLSMFYGIIITAQCTDPVAESEVASGSTVTAPSAPAAGFPNAVLGYRFGSEPGSAQATCVAAGASFHALESSATCVSKDERITPTLELEYEQGALVHISLIHRVPEAHMNASFDRLESSLRDQYGFPQVRRRLSERCATAMSACLVDGEVPRGPAWRWPAGSVELMPTLDEGVPVIALRYLHR